MDTGSGMVAKERWGRGAGSRLRWTRLGRETSGQSLLETALFVPILTLAMAYAVDYGYFFFVAANITSAARSAAIYSVMGNSSPAQISVPPAGPVATTASVAGLAVADLNLHTAATTTRIQVCSQALGMSGNIPVCANYGVAGATYTPATDPEAPTFVLQRVDITYTVQPPVPISFFSVSLISSMQFHRSVSMREME